MRNLLSNKIFLLLPFICFFAGYYLTSHFFFNTKLVVPHLTGKQLSECAPSLAQQRLSIRFLSEREDANLPEGTIVEQIPAPGQNIRPQQQILLITTKKPETLKTPNFLKLNKNTIQEISEKIGITPKYITLATSHNKEYCLAQTPRQDEPNPEKKVTLILNQIKQDYVIMPDLLESSVEEIQTILKKYNIKLDVFYLGQKVTISSCLEYQCINQSPIAGTLLNLKNPPIIQIEIG